MQVVLTRHGMTAGNAARRYIGATDEPLSPEGRRQAESLSCRPRALVFVTPLRRTRETAAILFPEAEQRVVPGLREMDFGAFEERSAQEMENDAAYRAWVDGGCLAPCPGGESRETFSRRVCAAFSETLVPLRREGCAEAVFVLHGGSIMAILERFGRPRRDFYEYALPNARAFVCRAAEAEPGEGLPFVLTQLRTEAAL